MSATKMLKLGAKIAVSGGLIAFVLYRIGQQAEWDDLAGRLASLSAPWVALAFAAQLGAMCFTIWRWRLLLQGQEMDVPLRHLVGAFMIGRFIGTFTPSTIGLDGYRMYDMAKHSGLVARSVSVILVEKIIGFFVLSLLVLATLPWGLGILPGSTLASIGALYSVPFILALVLLAKPALIGRLLGLIFRPGSALGAKVEKAAAAVTTYEARRDKLVRAVLAGLPVHVLTIFIFVSTGMAIGAPISVTDMLFVGPLVITATVLPVSLSGLGVREAAYIFLLTRTGVTVGEAALLSFLGYLVGRAISLFGGLVWLARRSGYKVDIGGKAMQEAAAAREAEAETAGRGLVHGVQANSELQTPNSKHAFLSAGFGAGLLAGVAAGLIEMTYILIRVAPPRPWGDLGYAAAFYGVFCAVVGAAIALTAWSAARWGGRGRAWLRPSPEGLYAGIGLSILCGLLAVVSRFRVFRDAFDERLAATSVSGLAIQAAILFVACALFAVGFIGLRAALRTRGGGLLLRPWGSPALAAIVVALGFAAGAPARPGSAPAARPAAVAAGPNIVFVMIDTLRADALGAYNPERAGATPAIDSLARDGVLFEQAFVQASWTRPSVASVMTGRFPTAHGAVHKDDALPDAAPTLAELLRDRGWATAGIVTNYNLAPAFNYQQGFEEYVYLEPRRFFWASDAGAKLALYEILRKVRARRFAGAHDVDRYYQDARRTTDEALAWIDRYRRSGDARPFFLFVQYMDPHDPYFAHDGSGEAYGQALAPNPPREKLDRIIELYHGEVSFTDRHVGRLLDGLRDLGLYDPAIVVVWADHGVEFQEHGGWWHGTTLYDEQVHVPLIVKPAAAEGVASAARPGTRVPTWVSLIDVPWTLLRWAGHAAGDLAALGYVGADLFVPRAAPVVFMEQDHQGNVLRALRYVGSDGSPYKYIEAEAIARPGLQPRELYEVAAPERSPDLRRAAVVAREQRNLADARAPQAAEGRARVAQPAEAARLAALPEQRVDAVTDEERLRALGYITDHPAPAPGRSAP